MISVLTSETVTSVVTDRTIYWTSLASLSSILGEISRRTRIQTGSIKQKVATETRYAQGLEITNTASDGTTRTGGGLVIKVAVLSDAAC